MKRVILTNLIAVAALFFAGCGSEKKSESAAAKPAVKKEVVLPESLLLKQNPEKATAVAELRKTAKPEQEVTVIGDIGGNRAPFVEGRASFMIADETALKGCSSTCKGCPTPWDYCCETPERKKAALLTVQFLDKDGMVYKKSIKGFHGIKEQSKVIVTGKVDKASNKDVTIINAEKIFVVKPTKAEK